MKKKMKQRKLKDNNNSNDYNTLKFLAVASSSFVIDCIIAYEIKYMQIIIIIIVTPIIRWCLSMIIKVIIMINICRLIPPIASTVVMNHLISSCSI